MEEIVERNSLVGVLQSMKESQKIAEFADGYRETLKYDLEDAIEQQEQQNNEDFNAGREEALKYAIEMIDKHLNTP